MRNQLISIQRQVLKTSNLVNLVLMLVFAASSINAQSTQRSVTGVVGSNDGPVYGAAVVLKGTSVGVASDENGAFKFPQLLKENDVLVVSYLGYITQEVTITGNTTVVKPFLDDTPLVIVAALRTEPKSESYEIDPN